MATHSRLLAWDSPMERGAWQGYSPWGRKESDTTERQQVVQVASSQEEKKTKIQTVNKYQMRLLPWWLSW